MIRPPDFALHGTDHPFLDIRWRLDRNDGVVLAVGLVEAARRGGIAEVTLELQGLDKSGNIVSRSVGTTYGGPLYQGDSRPFTVRLRPTGEEDRFELRVWSFLWEFGKDGGAPGR